MRSDKNPDVFFQKMKKKPALQKILDNLDSYSTAELLVLKDQPAWIRKELVDLKKRGGKSSEQSAESIADLMQRASQKPYTNPILYEVRRYIGESFDLPTGKNRRLKAIVEIGDLFRIIDPVAKEVKWFHSFAYMTDQEWINFMNGSEQVGFMTENAYRVAIQTDLAKKHDGLSIPDCPTLIAGQPVGQIVRNQGQLRITSADVAGFPIRIQRHS